MRSASSRAFDPEEPQQPDVNVPLLGHSASNAKASYHTVPPLPATADGTSSDDGEKFLVSLADGSNYFPHLHIWSFFGIAVLVLDHGNWRYSYYNLFFVQNWALQIIFVIFGVCFGMMRTGSGSYFLRLLIYLVAGVLCNMMAYAIKDPATVGDNIWNVVFQFWLVLGLIGYSVLLMPVKSYLRKLCDMKACACDNDGSSHAEREAGFQSRDGPSTEQAVSCKATKPLFDTNPYVGVVMIGAGSVFIWAAMSLVMARVVDGAFILQIEIILQRMGNGMAYWVGDTKTALTSVCASTELTLSNVWLALAVPSMFPSQQGLTVWLLVLNMHARRLSIWYSGIGQKLWHGFDLMLIGLVVYHLGMRWRRTLGERLVRYWFVWVAACGAVWQPGTEGRFDLWNSEPFYIRWRMMVLDIILLVVWLTAADRLIDSKIFTEDKCAFITYLGMFLFLVHEAIHIVLPEPFNWLMIISFGPMFWFLWRSQQKTA